MLTETTIEPLPELAPQAETEPIGFYGFRALTFLLETGCYATLDDQALDLAFNASQSAIAGPLDDTARDRLVGVRRMIVLVLADRASYRRACARDTVQADPELTTEGSPALGELSQSDQALRLLKAALTLIMGDQTDDPGNGGSRVPNHPRPNAPGPSTALPIPRSNGRSDDIAF